MNPVADAIGNVHGPVPVQLNDSSFRQIKFGVVRGHNGIVNDRILQFFDIFNPARYNRVTKYDAHGPFPIRDRRIKTFCSSGFCKSVQAGLGIQAFPQRSFGISWQCEPTEQSNYQADRHPSQLPYQNGSSRPSSPFFSVSHTYAVCPVDKIRHFVITESIFNSNLSCWFAWRYVHSNPRSTQ